MQPPSPVSRDRGRADARVELVEITTEELVGGGADAVAQELASGYTRRFTERPSGAREEVA